MTNGRDFLNELRTVLPEKIRGKTNLELDHTLLNDPMFLQLMKSSPSAIAIFSYKTMTYEYFSPNMSDLLGYPLSKLYGTSGAEFILNTFHPDHLKILMKISETVKKFYYEYSMAGRAMDTRITWTLQLKKGDGQYMWTMQQTTVLEVSPEGFPLRTLVFVSDISGIKTNSKVDFVCDLKRQDGLGYDTLLVSHYDAITEYKFTEREIQILNCVKKGLRNHEIADRLHISKHTVITHRRNIMKKTGKENIIQLLVD